MSSLAIGIDLGTTNTCVAVFKSYKVDIIANEAGSKTFPSIVCFSNEGIKVGHAAKDEEQTYLDATVYGIKRIIGSRFDNKQTQNDIKKWPFNVIEKGESLAVKVKDEEYYPEEISAMVLKHAKHIAEDHIGQEVTKAVITVPAYFNNCQRQATKDAGKIAGLDALRIINEPTAAALAFGWDNGSEKIRKVLVYDFGGGTFDVSVVKIEGKKYQVIATDGDTHLGGADIDDNLVDYVIKVFDSKYATDIRSDKDATMPLNNICTRIKEKLSFHQQQHLKLRNIHKGHDLEIVITREKLEEINMSIFERTMKIVDACLTEGKIKKSDITDVVLVGGSTRIPRIQKLLSDYFNGKIQLKKNINPDEAVAYGAAIQAAILDESIPEYFDTTKISDVTPLSLGMKLKDGSMKVFIKRNTPIPCKHTSQTETAHDNQSAIDTKIYQGEHVRAVENYFLGDFIITGLPLRPKGGVTKNNTFSLDENGVLHVNADIEGFPELKGKINIQLTEYRLSQADLTRIMSKPYFK